MKTLLTLFIALCLGVATLSAQGWTKWVNMPATGYQAGQCKMVTSTTSACNKGTEPFNVFIKKFSTNAKFRKLRLKITKDSYPETLSDMKSQIDVLSTDSADISRMFEIGNRPGYIATWFNVTANEACFHGEEFPVNDDEDYWGGCGWSFRFQRIGGKWYCTGVMLAG